MKKMIFLFVVCAIAFMTFSLSVSAAGPVSSFAYNITTQFGEDASTEANINFNSNTDKAYVEYTLATDAEFKNALKQEPTVTKQEIPAKQSSWVSTGYPTTAYKCEVTLTNLTPNTNYIYRVTNGSQYSNVFKFKTAPEDNQSFTFAAMADPQFADASGAKSWYSIMEQAYEKDPNLAFTIPTTSPFLLFCITLYP